MAGAFECQPPLLAELAPQLVTAAFGTLEHRGDRGMLDRLLALTDPGLKTPS